MHDKLFELSHKELELLVAFMHSKDDFITDILERYVLYEAYKRYLNSETPLTIKWVEQTLRLSFPKVYSVVQKLIKDKYLTQEKSSDDGRILHLVPTEKLIKGIILYEKMKLNELHALGITKEQALDSPSLSEFTLKTKKQIKKEFL